MRSLSYRARQRLRKGLKIGLICLGVFAGLVLLATIFLGRYVVYGPGGAYFDFGRDTSLEIPVSSTEPAAPVVLPEGSVEFQEPVDQARSASEVGGYYIDLPMLQDPEKVFAALQELTEPCTVMIDLKGGNGSFYYSTGLDGAKLADVDIETVDQILTYLKGRGFPMIAKVKAFADTNFADQHRDVAIRAQGGSLLVYNKFYWIDPDSELVVDYLKQVVRDLSLRGFKEIVFDDFYYPSDSKVVYTSEKTRAELMDGVAEELTSYFSSSGITISFGNPAADLTPPASSHVFISGVDGSGVSSAVERFSHLEAPTEQLVFLTASNDTRFNGYQLLRPLRD